MENNWITFVVVAALSSVGFNFLNRYVLRTSKDSTTYAWWFEVFRTFIFVPFLFVDRFTIWNTTSLLWFLAIGIAEFLSVYVYMKMHSLAELSISSIIVQLRLVWVPVLAFLFLRENLNFPEYAGIVVIFLGQVIIFSPKNLRLANGYQYALLASLFNAVNTVVGKFAVNYLSPQAVVAAMGVPAIIGFPFLMKNGIQRIKMLSRANLKKIFLATLFNSATMVLFILALKLGPAGKVNAIFQGVFTVNILIGIIFLGERKNILQKIAGSAVVALGVLLLI